ncbi:MAG: GatB/YqeY domain-containing protein [Candidatus Tectomicrobia bacterium]|nr:GatB/YqeY domain-containing protein [Candidatus Tectomicrobia bacterium]
MALKERLRTDLTTSLKAADKVKLSVVRLLQAAIKNREIELRRELTDEEVLAVITSSIKQRRESIKYFEEGGRADLVEKETQELGILSAYLPPQLGEEEVRPYIQAAIAETGASGPKDLGKVMKQVMARLKGQAAGEMVSRLAREMLS